MSLAKYATPAERRITTKIVKDALAQGWRISVNDGEEWVVKKALKEQTVLEALCSTDMDTLRFRKGDGTKVGDVILVWGNDEDVITDHSANDAMNDFMANRY